MPEIDTMQLDGMKGVAFHLNDLSAKRAVGIRSLHSDNIAATLIPTASESCDLARDVVFFALDSGEMAYSLRVPDLCPPDAAGNVQLTHIVNTSNVVVVSTRDVEMHSLALFLNTKSE